MSLAGRLLLLASLLATTPGWAGEPLQIEGTWFVLVHYRDTGSANPEADRWLDYVWRFEHAGTRLEWAHYPIVVFEDATGRFESRGGNPRARVLAAWEPNEAQRATIDAGPRVNDRGAQIKSLRGSDVGGWKTVNRTRPLSASPSIVGYQLDLSVTNLVDKPVFKRGDLLGRAGSASAEGDAATFTVEEVRSSGRVLVGRYERGEHLRGRFRMWRTPPARGLVQKEGTVNQRLERRAYETLMERREDAAPGDETPP